MKPRVAGPGPGLCPQQRWIMEAWSSGHWIVSQTDESENVVVDTDTMDAGLRRWKAIFGKSSEPSDDVAITREQLTGVLAVLGKGLRHNIDIGGAG